MSDIIGWIELDPTAGSPRWERLVAESSYLVPSPAGRFNSPRPRRAPFDNSYKVEFVDADFDGLLSDLQTEFNSLKENCNKAV